MIGRAKTWLYPAKLFLLKRLKSAKFTAIDEKSPMMLFNAVKAGKR